MSYLSLLLFLVVISQVSAYAIEGLWQSKDYNKTDILVSAISTDQNGLNHYQIDIDGCSPSLSFAISQSYMKLTNLGKPVCTPGIAATLMNDLQEKILYFQIYYDQLSLVNIFGNKSLVFVRVKKDMRNNNLLGVFATPKGSQVTITNQSVLLCNNSLKFDYAGNSKDSLKVNDQKIIGGCQDHDSNNILSQLQQANYYRLQNPSVLRLYAANYSQIGELNKVKNLSDIIPVVSDNAVQLNNTHLNQNYSNSNNTGTTNQDVSIVVPTANDKYGNQTTSGTDTSTSSGTQPSTVSSVTNSSTIQSNSSTQSSASSDSSSEQNSSFTTSTDYSTIRLTYSMAAAVWFPQYFMVSDQSTWPTKVAINATNLAFIGCNTVTIPFIINYSTLNTTVGSTITQSRKACGNIDQPYIDLIKKSQRVMATANQTAFKLIFYDKNNSTLFAVSRNLTAAEKKNLVMDATNPTAIPNTSYPIPIQTSTSVIVTNSSNSSQASSSSNSSSSTSSTSTTSTTTSNGATSTSAASSSSTQSSSASSTASSSSTSTSTSTTTTSTPSTSILVGRYNPSKVGVTSLPSALTSNIFFIFTPTFIFVTGTCNNYVYPYSLNQQGSTTLLNIDVAGKQVQTNSNCDSSNDDLFIQPFEQSKSITLISTGNKISMNLASNAGNPTLSLSKTTLS